MDIDVARTRREGTFDRDAYWRATLRRLLWLLAVWALVGPVMSIVFVQELNQWSIGGIPFGFWMGQQGSIYVFVALIFLNAYLADRTDREFGVDETPETTRHVVSGH
ncbi:MAG: DUF4212 domain-containing protein [Gemmatimonadota bacterium]|jgi:putative solute:sodium symporter small subunit|nr:DUF4212 domain-containing protein [Gemmatimonadota bacterium]